jgi:hypothetical protein
MWRQRNRRHYYALSLRRNSEDATEETIKEVRENEMATLKRLKHLRFRELRCLDWRRENYLHKCLAKVSSVGKLFSAAGITKLTFWASVLLEFPLVAYLHLVFSGAESYKSLFGGKGTNILCVFHITGMKDLT